MFLCLFSFSAPKMQSIETQQPVPISQCLSVVAPKRESGRVLPYLSKIFNLFNVLFRKNICSSICFLLARQKCSQLRHSNPSPCPQCLSVVARTNESQVGFLTYLNKIFNLLSVLFPTNICSYIYFLIALRT